MNFILEFQKNMLASGLTCPEIPFADGKLHRFKNSGDNHLNSWYILHSGELPAGAFGCWKLGIRERWCNKLSSQLSPNERKALAARIREIKVIYEKERESIHSEAKKRAQEIWQRSKPAIQNHPYLLRKKITAHGIHCQQDSLIIPIHDPAGEIYSLQFIKPNGDKLFLDGGAIIGHYHSIGKPTNTLFICEGYATGATIYQTTDCGVMVAFSCGNLLEVAKVIRKNFPSSKLVIAADDDRLTLNNPGLTKARETAEKVGAILVAPSFKDQNSKFSDFNDLLLSEGLEEVKNQLNINAISKLLTPVDISKISLFEQSGEKQKKKSQATLLIEIANLVELFHDEREKPYAIIANENGSKRIYAINSCNFKNWLSQAYYCLTSRGCNKACLNDALTTIEAKAKYKSPKRNVYSRIARIDNKIFVDLGDEHWRVVEITEHGWQILELSPVMFIRNNSMEPLPMPIRGGNISDLWQPFNLNNESCTLVLGWLLCAYRGKPPYIILNVQGEEGSGKTFLCNFLRSLIDPSIGENRNMPSDDKELLTAIVNNAVISLDNISKIENSLSDTLCRMTTGGAISFRALFTDNDEVLHKIARPIILNGITDIVTRPDLLSRCISIHLEAICDKNRKSEEEMLTHLTSTKPNILGVIFDLIAGGLKEINNIAKPKNLPRLADCVLWVTAVEKGSPSLQEGDFLKCYGQNIKCAIEDGVEASPVANAVLTLMDTKFEWTGTATELLHELDRLANDRLLRSKAWAQTPKSLSNIIKRYKAQLRKLGIEVNGYRSHGRNLITILKIENFDTPHTPDPLETNTSEALTGVGGENYATPTHTPNAISGVSENNAGVDRVYEENGLHTPAKPFVDAALSDSGVRGVCKNPNFLKYTSPDRETSKL